MAMSLAAAANARQRLSEVNPDGANYFIEKLLVQIYEHFDEQCLTDVTFKLSNPTALVSAHRLILSAASPYFKEFFKSDSGICPLVDITDIDSDTFERLITFCYTGKALITIDNVDRMLKAALILELDDAVTNCVYFVIEHIADYTLERAYKLERDTQCGLLSEKILEYEIANFMTVIQSAEFLNFNASKLQIILASDDLNVPTEKDAFEAVKRWYEHDASVRKQMIPDIISHLRLTQFDTNFIMKNVQPLPGCHFVALEVVSWVNVPSTREAISLKFTNPRCGWSDQSAFLAFKTLVIQSAEFLNFDASKLKTILESDNLNVPTENDVFGAVKRWYEHDASVRKQMIPDIISHLRLTQFDPNFIMKNVKPLPCCHVVALEAVSWVNVPSIRDDLSLRFTNPRSGWSDQSTFLAFKIWQGEPRTIFQYNKAEDLWQKWVDIKIDVQRFRVIFMDDNLIFIGGHRNQKPINEVSSWNFKTKTFKQLPPMNQPRWLHCVVILNDKIYAIGGKGANGDILQSVEMYSVSNGWKSVNSMITPRCYVNAVVLKAKIYVIGGNNGSNLKSMEYYDPTTNCWAQCADMNEIHSSAGATVHNGYIFVVGGYNGINTPTVERYDPQRNVWTKICSLSIGLQNIECFSIDNQLWAVGGYNKECKNCVSIYDEKNDKWIDKKPIPLPGRYYCFNAPKSSLNSE